MSLREDIGWIEFRCYAEMDGEIVAKITAHTTEGIAEGLHRMDNVIHKKLAGKTKGLPESQNYPRGVAGPRGVVGPRDVASPKDRINDLLDGIYHNSELGNVIEIKKLLEELEIGL